MPKGDAQKRKGDYFNRLYDLLDNNTKIFVVEADNVGSNQMHKIRISLRGKASILMGKNTMVRKALRSRLSSNPALEKLLPFVRGNVGFVFTNDDLSNIREFLLKERVSAPARAGAIAPADVFIDAQNTGFGPEKTSFFQALGIATKISKGTIEIINQVHIVVKGSKVGASEAALLNMLKISPFTYGLTIVTIYDNGSIYGSEMLDITDEHLLKQFAVGLRNITCISLGLGIPTTVAVPHFIANAYKNLLAIAVETEYSFPAADKVKEYLKDPSKFAVAAPVASTPAASTTAATPAAAKVEEKKEESDEEMGFGLFD
jgi:large subunit ribosomal protein LP0